MSHTALKGNNEVQANNYQYEHCFPIEVPHCPHSPFHSIGSVVVKTDDVFVKQKDLFTIECADLYRRQNPNTPIGHEYTFTLKNSNTSTIAFKALDESTLPSNRFVTVPLVVALPLVRLVADDGVICKSDEFQTRNEN